MTCAICTARASANRDPRRGAVASRWGARSVGARSGGAAQMRLASHSLVSGRSAHLDELDRTRRPPPRAPRRFPKRGAHSCSPSERGEAVHGRARGLQFCRNDCATWVSAEMPVAHFCRVEVCRFRRQDTKQCRAAKSSRLVRPAHPPARGPDRAYLRALHPRRHPAARSRLPPSLPAPTTTDPNPPLCLHSTHDSALCNKRASLHDTTSMSSCRAPQQPSARPPTYPPLCLSARARAGRTCKQTQPQPTLETTRDHHGAQEEC